MEAQRRPDLKKYIRNSSWLGGEKIFTLVIGFLINAVVARHLGPASFGFLSYAISAASLVAVAGHLGLSGLVVQSLVKERERAPEILGTVFTMKLAACAAGFLVLIAIAFATESPTNEKFWALVIIGASTLLRPWEVIDFWFQSNVQGKNSAISHLSAQLISAAAKLSLVAVGAGLLLFSVVNVLQALAYATIISTLYFKRSGVLLRNWKFSRRAGKELLVKGGLVFAGTALGVINLKVDQIMLQWLRGSSEVGQYAVAAMLSEAWYFVPAALVVSVFPRLIQLRDDDPGLYARRLQQLLDVLMLLGLGVAFVVILVATPFITLVYGDNYAPAAAILKIHIVAGVFMFMRAALSRWIIVENLLVFSLVTQGLGACANVLLNLLFIPLWGGVGAAVATLISYAVSTYFALALHSKSRPMFFFMSKALAAPIRYPIHYCVNQISKRNKKC